MNSPANKRVLVKRLDDALAAYAAGDSAGAIRELEKFIDFAGQHVDDPPGQEWINDAQAIIDRIRSGT